MSMTKKLMTLLLAMLALTACEDSMEEPKAEKKYDVFIAAHGSGSNGDLIYSLQGDTVYECEQWVGISHIESEGKDWYAVIGREDENNHLYYSIVKNGNETLFTTRDYISSMRIDHGNVYLLQLNRWGSPNRTWVTKNSEVIFSLEDTDVFLARWMRVQDGDVILTGPARTSKACYWKNGNLIDIPDVEGPMELGCFIALDEKNELIGFSMDKNGQSGYLLNGKRKDLQLDGVTRVEFINGKPFIVGLKYIEEERTTRPVVVFDDSERVLPNSSVHTNYGYELKILKRGNSVYYFEPAPHIFYKDLTPLAMGDNVSQLHIIDYTVVEK